MITPETISKYRREGSTNIDILGIVSQNDPALQARFSDKIINNPALEDWEREKAAQYYIDKKYFGSNSVVSPNGREFTSAIKPAPDTQNVFQSSSQGVRDFAQNGTPNLLGSIGRELLPAGPTRTGPNLFERVKQDINSRGQDLRTTLDKHSSGTIGNVRAVGETFKTLTGGVKDVFGEVLQTASGVLPKFIETGISQFANDLGVPEKATEMSSAYQEWSQQHPDAALALESIGNLGGAAANAYGLQSTGQQLLSASQKATGGVKEFFDPNSLQSQQQAKALAQPGPQSRTQELVMPKTTEKVIKDVGTKNPSLVKKGLFKNTLLPDEYQKELDIVARDTVPGFGQTSDVVENATLVNSTIENRSSALLSRMKESNALVSHKEMASKVGRAASDAAAEFGESKGIFDSTAGIFNRISKSHPGTIAGQWQARIEFYKEMTKRFGESIFEKGNARAEAVRAVAEAANTTINGAAGRAGVSFLDEMDIISKLYDVRAALGTKLTTSGPVRTFLKSPAGRITTGAAAGAGLTTIGVSSMQ